MQITIPTQKALWRKSFILTERYLFFGLLSLLLLVIWLYQGLPIPPLPESDSHTHHSLRGFRSFMQNRHERLFNGFPSMLGHYMSAIYALKLWVSTYLIGFLLAFRYTMRAIHKSESFFSLIGFVLAFHLPFQMGQYNFSVGVIMYMLIIRYWYLIHNKITLQGVTNLSLLLLGLLLLHPVPYIMAVVTLLSSVVFSSFVVWPNTAKRFKKVLMNGISRLIVMIFATLPSMPFLIYDLYESGKVHPGREHIPFNQLLMSYSSLYVLHFPGQNASYIQYIFLLLLTAVVISAVLHAFKQHFTVSRHMFFFSHFAAVAIYFFFWYLIDDRQNAALEFQLFPWLILCFWFAQLNFPFYQKGILMLAMTFLALDEMWPLIMHL